MTKEGIWLAVLATIAALAVPATAAANPAYEPNNGIHEAYGPLAAATNYDATISASNDPDWYVVYVSGPGVLDVALTNNDQNTCCSGLTAGLYDSDGKYLNEVSVDEGATRNIPYTTPGAGHYYVRVRGGVPPDNYRQRLTGPITTGPRPGAAEPTPNASRTPETAFGPLEGDKLYGGSIDASGEVDWFTFNTSGAGAFDLAFTNIYDEGCCSAPSVALYDREGIEDLTPLTSVTVEKDTIGHLRYTSAGAEQFFVQVRSGTPVDRYQFRITPASLLTATVPPAAPPAGGGGPIVDPECSAAQSKLAKARSRLAAAKDKGAAKKRIKKLKAKVRAAKQQVSGACGA